MKLLNTICSDITSILKGALPSVLALRRQRQKKSDGSYVTKGDLLLQELIFSYIEDLNESIFLISEEKDNSLFSFSKFEYAVVLDPIDGTENFTSGLREWGVGVSVYYQGRHVESLLALPELDIYLRSGDTIEYFSSRITGLSSSITPILLEKLKPGEEYRIFGCSMYNMYNVICGSYAEFCNPVGANVWDILPGLNLALEHNCTVLVNNCNYDGAFLYPTQKYSFQIFR